MQGKRNILKKDWNATHDNNTNIYYGLQHLPTIYIYSQFNHFI
jgi:hypothetical protein